MATTLAAKPAQPTETASSKRVGGIEDHESAPYIIKNEIGKVGLQTMPTNAR